MKKYNFKIGDKVKLKGSHYCGISSNDIGEVVGFGRYIEVSWRGDLGRRLGSYPHILSEIEHVFKVGQQLVFPFMEE